MDERSSNNGKSEGKGKAPSSKDLHEQISCPNEGTIIFEEENLPETKDAEGKEITESSSKDTQENIHPSLPADTIVFSPLDQDVVSEDVNEQMPNCNDGTVIVQERKEVEGTSDAKGKEIAEGSISNEQENVLQEQISELVSGLTKVDVVVTQMNDGCVDKILRITYPCGFCTKMFPSAQALGGHQNIPREEREVSKRRKKSGEPNLSNPSPTPMYTNFNLYFNRESHTTPPPSVPKPRGSTQYPLGYFGRSMTMSFNDRQFPYYDRPRLIGPYQRSSGNVNNAGGNLNSVGLLGGQQGNGRGSGSFSTLGRMLTGNSNTGGFEAASTSTGRGNNTVGLYPGGNNENQDPVRCGDGIIDLLSRVGMGNGADEEGDGDHGDNETES
ncbi:zinc finger, C2H2 [Tanacetum coccineum]